MYKLPKHIFGWEPDDLSEIEEMTQVGQVVIKLKEIKKNENLTFTIIPGFLTRSIALRNITKKDFYRMAKEIKVKKKKCHFSSFDGFNFISLN